MRNKRKKPGLKDIISAMAGMQMQIEQLKMHIHNGDKALDEYLKMKGDKEAFVAHIEKNYNKDDKDNKETKEE